jgi:hypothetical protein
MRANASHSFKVNRTGLPWRGSLTALRSGSAAGTGCSRLRPARARIVRTVFVLLVFVTLAGLGIAGGVSALTGGSALSRGSTLAGASALSRGSTLAGASALSRGSTLAGASTLSTGSALTGASALSRGSAGTLRSRLSRTLGAGGASLAGARAGLRHDKGRHGHCQQECERCFSHS